VFQNFGVEFTWVSATNTENVAKAIKDNTQLFWLETPTNPLMNLCDVEAVAKIGKKRDIVTVVDNTFMTPYFQNPLELGADIVVHSMTKYLGGHSDVLGGAVMLSNEKLYKRIKFGQNAVGAVLSPFDCYTVLRGIKTLPLRMERHDSNARRIAEFLVCHPKVTKVHYPGLPTHPQHELAKKQMSGFGGMLSFEIKGTVEDAKGFLRRVKTFTLADSLGGVESLIGHPASMSHSAVPESERKRVGVTDTLIRVSVGTENIEDLISDLEQALG
jgi:cystathionine gamma-lyase